MASYYHLRLWLQTLQMEVEVLNKGATGLRNFHVGKSKDPLKTIIPRLNEKITVNIELAHISRHGNYKKGFVSFVGALLDAERAKGKLYM
ncbi:hypothetical protein EON65_39605 [archaeon]|nr:MAG: hypothetical protein EON65_39605 [archaeon]